MRAGCETVKAGGHCRVGSEKVSRSSDGQSDFEGLSCLLHETAGAFQHGKGRMAFIQMTDFRLDAKRSKEPPSADPEEQFLLETQLRSAAIEFAGNSSMGWESSRRHCCRAGKVLLCRPGPARRAARPSNQVRRSPTAATRRLAGAKA